MTQPRGPATQDVAAPDLLGHHRFRAMNTDVEFFLLDIDQVALFPAAEELFHSLESQLSRFLPESELSRLNARSGQEVQVSELMMDILARAADLHHATGGIFEPAVLADLERAGYDRSFEQVDRTGEAVSLSSNGAHASIAAVRLDARRMTVTAPEGVRIDLGGIGKGYTVDATARLLAPARDFVVNAGGDIYASGSGTDGDGWLIAVTDPFDANINLSLVRLYDEALATSTTAARRWQRGGRLLHHLIDPRTRRPAESGVLSVTVIARTAVQADVFAKTALLLGAVEGPRFLERQSAPGYLVLDDGSGVCTSGWTGTRPS